MGLSRALTGLPSDREFEAMLRDLLRALADRTDVWLSLDDAVRIVNAPRSKIASTLSTLVDAFVLDCDVEATSPSYRLRQDSTVRREVDAFVRRAERHSGMMQANVAKFRQRYGGR